MRYIYSNQIKEGREGLKNLLQNPQVQNLIKKYSIDDKARQRIASTSFKDNHPYFFQKKDWLTAEPAATLGKEILEYNDETIKWFLLLYFVSAASNLMKTMILDYLDQSVIEQWGIQKEMTEHQEEAFERERQLIWVREGEIEKAVDDIIDVNKYIIFNPFNLDENTLYRYSVTQFVLTAGYHYAHDDELVPEPLLKRHVDMPFILSISMYISVLTGKDFYDILYNTLKEMGSKDCLEDVIAMVRKNKELEKLRIEKAKLELLAAENEEKRKQQVTAEEIIADAFGKGIKKELIEDRIKKCNDKEHRDILYKMEALAGKQLSYLDKLNESAPLTQVSEQIKNEYGIVFSDEESDKCHTIENFVDTLIQHISFIKDFKYAALHNKELEPLKENDDYNLTTRIREVELLSGKKIDNRAIHTIQDLVAYYSDNNNLMKKIITIVAKQLELETDEVTPESNLFEDLGADSLDAVELIMEAEKELGISITDEEVEKITTVQDMFDVVTDIIHRKSQQ